MDESHTYLSFPHDGQIFQDPLLHLSLWVRPFTCKSFQRDLSDKQNPESRRPWQLERLMTSYRTASEPNAIYDLPQIKHLLDKSNCCLMMMNKGKTRDEAAWDTYVHRQEHQLSHQRAGFHLPCVSYRRLFSASGLFILTQGIRIFICVTETNKKHLVTLMNFFSTFAAERSRRFWWRQSHSGLLKTKM